MVRRLLHHLLSSIALTTIFFTASALAESSLAKTLLNTKAPEGESSSFNTTSFLQAAFEPSYLADLAKSTGASPCPTIDRLRLNCAPSGVSTGVSTSSLSRDAIAKLGKRMTQDALSFSPTLSAIANGKMELNLSMLRLYDRNAESAARPVYQLNDLGSLESDTGMLDLPRLGQQEIVPIWHNAASLKNGEVNSTPALSQKKQSSNLERDHFGGLKLRLARGQGIIPTVGNTAVRVENSSGLLFAELPNLKSTDPKELKTGVSVTWERRTLIFSSANSGKNSSLTFSDTDSRGATARIIIADEWNESIGAHSASLNLSLSLPM